MAFTQPEELGTIDFIHPKDPAIDPESDIEAYREDWDFEAHCKLKDGENPTIFKVNCDLPYKKVVAIQNAAVSLAKNKMNVTLGSQTHLTVRYFLEGIESPTELDGKGLYYGRDRKDGLADTKTIRDLEKLKLINDLHDFWQTKQELGRDSFLKKN